MLTQPVSLCVHVYRRGSGERKWDTGVGWVAVKSQNLYCMWAERVNAVPSASPRFMSCI